MICPADIAASSATTFPCYAGSVLQRELLDQIFTDHTISGVVHLAGFKYAGVSVSRPLHTYTQNVTGMITLLESMADNGVSRFVFSSSAAVYGTPGQRPGQRDDPTRPESPYGESKLVGEWLLRDQATATASDAAPLRHTSLRYFNVVGSGYDDLRDTSPHNLFPLIFERLVAGEVPTSMATTTRLPTAPRCVTTSMFPILALSHVAAAKASRRAGRLQRVYNLGSGTGLSVREIMDAVKRVTGHQLSPGRPASTPGDPARIVATGDLAGHDLNWKMRHTVDEMVASAWSARQAAEQQR
jgi:UDP-glucose 4-epimerase